MAEESYPFSNAQVVNEGQWSRLFRPAAGDGVQLANPSDPALKVTANGTPAVSVTAGEATVNGFHYRLDTTKTLPVPTNFGNASPRVDRVVLRCSQTGNSAVPVYLKGGTIAPALATDRNNVFDLPLAQLTIAAGSPNAAAGAVTDERYSLFRPAAGFGATPNQYGVFRYVNDQLWIGDGSSWHPVLLGDGPRCRVWQSGTGEVIAPNTDRAIIFNEETYDPSGMHSTSGDPAFRKVIVPVAGVYQVLAAVSFDDDAVGGARSIIIVKNETVPAGGAGTGGTGIARASVPTSPIANETNIQCTGEVLMAAGEWLTVRARHSSSGNVSLGASSDRTFLQVNWIRSSL